MSIYTDIDSKISSSDDEIDEKQIQLEFEKQATEEYLFSKATTSNSITSLGTKEKEQDHVEMTGADDSDAIDQYDEVPMIVQDDDMIATASDKLSPSKQQKKTPLMKLTEICF